MIFSFHIDYKTVFGEELVLNVKDPARPESEKVIPCSMENNDGSRWTCRMEVDDNIEATALEYFYSVQANGSQRRHEWLTGRHRIDLTARRAKTYTVYNHWTDIPADSYRYSSAFTECITRRAATPPAGSDYDRTVRLVVRAPQLLANHRLYVVGADRLLGAWDVGRALPMTEHACNEWIVDVDAASMADRRMEFKFLAFETGSAGMPMWETGLNRIIELPEMVSGEVIVYDLQQAFFPLENVRLAGMLVPVFSLRSKQSFGVGDFGDLKRMIDFASAARMRVLQVLPVNDTTTTHTWTDSYPYSCISIFALHPMYVDLSQLPPLADGEARRRFETLRRELNALPQIDYERANNAKTEYLRMLFEEQGGAALKSPAFKTFFKESQQWLVPYAMYCHLRDLYGTAEFSRWPDHNVWDEALRADLSNSRTRAFRDVSFTYYVQFVLDSQMKAVHDYARQRSVILKGDIPIGVNRHGCDVWMEPRYFNTDSQAGAPPDDFSVNGQNWGFPTYNWEAMLADDCAWWVRRFQHMRRFFDAYRIDHVLGFFRIWEIPVEAVHGLLGHFSPALGMSRQEIENYGLHFQEALFTEPFITDWVLDRIFHERAGEVKERYLAAADNGRYRLKPEFDTQRKIEGAFEERKAQLRAEAADDADLQQRLTELDNLRDGLYALVSDVLFVRDHRDPNLFHPRISVQFDFIYESLYDSDKTIFNRIYNDYYYRRNSQFWYYEAMKKLPRLVEATRMLVCAEDLGMVPECVPWVMDELRILSLEIQSMPKDPKVRFGHLSRNPYRSVCTISSHDMPTLRQWWDENIWRTQDYYNTMLRYPGPAPHPLPGRLAADIVARHLASPSMLCVLSLQDWLSIDEHLRLPDPNAERINIPANPRHYWRYRMHLNIEDLMANEAFLGTLREMVSQAGRK